MGSFSLVVTVLFMLVGPVRLIPAFGGMTRGTDSRFKRDVAVRAAPIAAALCAFVALAGERILGRYGISFEALRISGALVLLIAALQALFARRSAREPASGAPTALQLAASPVAVPGIVPPSGIAAILIFMMLAPEYPGMRQAVAISLAIMMVLDFLVMYFIDAVLKTPGLMIVLSVLGSALVFVQVCLAMEMMVTALTSLGLFRA